LLSRILRTEKGASIRIIGYPLPHGYDGNFKIPPGNFASARNTSRPTIRQNALLPWHPYRYISKRCQELDSDLFQTRVFLHSGICITGPALAELFYDETRFKRSGVASRRFQKTLFGQGGVQGLDGPAHQHRKRMFLSLMTPERISRIGILSAEQWAACAIKWSKSDHIVLYHETCELLTRVACAWAECH
jgi:cytochrome P450